MSERGGIKTFYPKFTERGVLKTSPNAAYRFWWRGIRYTKAGFKTKALAREEGEKRKAELRAGQEEDWRQVTVQRLWDIAEARASARSEGTQISVSGVWKRLFVHFPKGMLLASIDEEALLRYVAKCRKEGRSANTIRLDLARLSQAMKAAHHKRLLPFLPEFPKVKRKHRDNAPLEHQTAMIFAQLPEHYRLYFRLARATSWRARSEIRHRQWTDVDEEAGVFRLDGAQTKTGKPRAPFPLNLTLQAVLGDCGAYVSDVQRRTGRIIPWVCCTPQGDQIPRNYAEVWGLALEKAGFVRSRDGKPWSSDFTPHDSTRRAAIRDWRRLGISREVRKELAGHVSDSAHAAYESQVGDAEQQRAAAMKMDQGLDERQLLLFRAKG